MDLSPGVQTLTSEGSLGTSRDVLSLGAQTNGSFGSAIGRLAGVRLSRETTVAISLLVTAGATYGDAVTSAATTFTLFYVLALAIGTWFAGVWVGYVIAICAVLGSTMASALTLPLPPHVWFLAWNGTLDLILYVGCVRVLWALRRRLECEVAARRDAFDQLRHAERLTTLGKLAAGIAHEIGTPLNVISGRAELIASGSLKGDAVHHSARMVIEQTNRVSQIIRQLLDFARRGGTRVARTDVTDLVETTALLLSSLAAKTGVEIVCCGSPFEASINRSEMQHVLTNLITNAIHAMPDGGKIVITTRIRSSLPKSSGAALVLACRWPTELFVIIRGGFRSTPGLAREPL